MVKAFLAVLVALSVAGSSVAQSPVSPSLITYPDPDYPSDSAQIFAQGTISTDAFEHSPPTFSADGKTVLWSIVSLPSWRATILEMNFMNGKWSKLHPVTFADTTASNIYPAFQPRTNILFYSSDKKITTDKRTSRGNVLWRVEKKSNEWSRPEPLDSTVSRGGDYAPSVAANGSVYFTHGPFRSPDWNIFAAKNQASGLQPPQFQPFNSTGYEDGAFIAPDESYVIFESNRPGGIAQSIDLYIAVKREDGTWSEAVNLGEKINTPASERFGRMSPDGKFFFFGSNRRQVNGKPNFDIYWIDAKIIDDIIRKISK